MVTVSWLWNRESHYEGLFGLCWTAFVICIYARRLRHMVRIPSEPVPVPHYRLSRLLIVLLARLRTTFIGSHYCYRTPVWDIIRVTLLVYQYTGRCIPRVRYIFVFQADVICCCQYCACGVDCFPVFICDAVVTGCSILIFAQSLCYFFWRDPRGRYIISIFWCLYVLVYSDIACFECY
jgi:hypothetical protein